MSVSIPIGERCLELSSVIWTPRERCQCVSKVGAGGDVTSRTGTVRLKKAANACSDVTSHTGTVRLEKGLRLGGDVTSRAGTVRLEK
eukprot:5502725-Pyramimonas_sp.AAC.1